MASDRAKFGLQWAQSNQEMPVAGMGLVIDVHRNNQSLLVSAVGSIASMSRKATFVRTSAVRPEADVALCAAIRPTRVARAVPSTPSPQNASTALAGSLRVCNVI